MDDGEWYIPSATGLEKIVYTKGIGLEKFAELIVEECMHQVLTGIKCNPPQSEPPEIAQILARRIQQHFGVEL